MNDIDLAVPLMGGPSYDRACSLVPSEYVEAWEWFLGEELRGGVCKVYGPRRGMRCAGRTSGFRPYYCIITGLYLIDQLSYFYMDLAELLFRYLAR